jgi:2-hydroxychromene-2-carboxylate isomerase
MQKQVEFFFDFGSPYTYLAYHELRRIAQARGAQIVWRPILLGGVFQATGNHSPAEIPAKALYSNVDLQRWAQAYGVPFAMNPHFPINTLALMRGAVAMQQRGEEPFQRYLGAMFGAMFEKPRNLNNSMEIGAVLADAGFDPMECMQAIQEPAVKEALKVATSEAVARGVFGVPTFFVGKEMYWGQDRLLFVDAALA